MSLWSQIKYAMNSTLGTSEFKPLDKIIEGQRTWGAGEPTIKILRESFSSMSETELGTFTPKVGGSIRIAANLVNTHASYASSTATLYVYEGDTLISYTKADSIANISVPFSMDIAITAGVKYTVTAKLDQSSNNRIVNARVCGNLIDASLME